MDRILTLYTIFSVLIPFLFQFYWDACSHAALYKFQAFPYGTVVKNPPANSGDTRDFGKIPWSRKWHPNPVFWARKCHGWRSLVGYSPGVTKSGTRLSTHTRCVSWRCMARWFWCTQGNDFHAKFSEHPSPHRHMMRILRAHSQPPRRAACHTPRHCTLKTEDFTCQLHRNKAGGNINKCSQDL